MGKIFIIEGTMSSVTGSNLESRPLAAQVAPPPRSERREIEEERPCCLSFLCEFELDHLGELARAVALITTDPFRGIFYFFFPGLNAYFSNHTNINPKDGSKDDANTAALWRDPKKIKRTRVVNEINLLRKAAGICRNIGSYTRISAPAYDSCGGSCSITNPVIVMPHSHMRLTGNQKPFAKEPIDFDKKLEPYSPAAIPLDNWKFTDDETRFFIAREVGQIGANYSILRVIIKVLFVAALFSIYALPVGWIGGMVLLLIDIGIYIISERCIQSHLDLRSVDILTKRFETEHLNRLATPYEQEKLESQIKANEITLLEQISPDQLESQINAKEIALFEQANELSLQHRAQAERLIKEERQVQAERLIPEKTRLGIHREALRTIQSETKQLVHNKAVERAARAAHSALNKLAQQNIIRQKKFRDDDNTPNPFYNPFCRAYITKKGNNILDVNHPLLTSRISQLENAHPFLN